MQALFEQLYQIDKLNTEGYIKNQQILKKQTNELQHKAKQQAGMHAYLTQAQQKKTMIQTAREQQRTRGNAFRYKKISRSGADDAFSLAIRLRANCTCERCGAVYVHNNMKELHCSHNYGRENKQVRFHPDNAFALCQDCHRWFARSKVESTQWYQAKLGQEKMQGLLLQMAKKDVPFNEEKIKAYYRLVYRQLLAMRQEGEQGYLPFLGYQDWAANWRERILIEGDLA